MNLGIIRLAFALLWMFVAWFFYSQGRLAQGNAGWVGPSTYDLMAGFACLMAIWNVVRWILSRRRPASPTENPLRPRRPAAAREERAEEYHPEFDFGNLPPKRDR